MIVWHWARPEFILMPRVFLSSAFHGRIVPPALTFAFFPLLLFMSGPCFNSRVAYRLTPLTSATHSLPLESHRLAHYNESISIGDLGHTSGHKYENSRRVIQGFQAKVRSKLWNQSNRASHFNRGEDKLTLIGLWLAGRHNEAFTASRVEPRKATLIEYAKLYIILQLLPAASPAGAPEWASTHRRSLQKGLIAFWTV